MNLFLEILIFDLKDRFKRFSTYIYFLMFFAFAFFIILAKSGYFPGGQIIIGGSNRVDINSPYTSQILTFALSFFSVFVIAPIFGQNAFKDHLYNFNNLTDSTSFSRSICFSARFLSAFFVSLFIVSSLALGLYLGANSPSIDSIYLGDFQFFSYIKPYLVGVLPNLIIFGAIFFFMGAFFKRMSFVYLSGVTIFLGWMLSSKIEPSLEDHILSSLIDPSGMTASNLVTKYWTVAQQNTNFIPLEGYLLYNRLLWMGIGILFLILARLFYEKKSSDSKKHIPKNERRQLNEVQKIQDIHYFSEKKYGFLSFLEIVKHEFMQSIKHPVVITLLFLGCGYVFLQSPYIGKSYEATTLPVTYKVIEMIGDIFSLFILIILTFWSGEMLWKERANHFDEVIDSSPASLLLLRLPKFIALNLLLLVLLGLLTLCGVIIQIFRGYYNFEIILYIKQFLFVYYPIYFGISCIAFLAHCLINNKFLAHGAMILYYIYFVFGTAFGVERNVFIINKTPSIEYSPMNHFGPNLFGHTILSMTWGFLSIAFVVIAICFSQRGKEPSFNYRFKQFKNNFNRTFRALTLIPLLFFLGFWGYSFYNTSVLNEFKTKANKIKASIRYEKEYREKWLYAPRPDFLDVNVVFNLYPNERRAKGSGKFILTNKFESNINEVLISVPNLYSRKIEIEGGYEVIKNDRKLEVQIIKLNQPLKPGEKRTLTYTYEIRNEGFKNSEDDTSIVKNGTYINKTAIFPSFGYKINKEEQNIKERHRYGLGEQKRSLDINNPISSKYTDIATDALGVNFQALVSTSEDQIIVAPGYLEKEWKKEGRYFAKYKMDTPILNSYSFLSARYKIAKDKWKDINIEVFYHKGHDINIDQMILATKKSLAYFSKNFSPYQYKQFRIFEFPRYVPGAMAFPNTIPFSEGRGFIHDIKNKDNIDYPFYITSHELAHQWFGYQIGGGQVPGYKMLTESLSQYGALMVIEKHFSKDYLKKYLRHELSRYLKGRSDEVKEELSLSKSENQGYIHYHKGSLVFYRLKEEIGEKKINNVIANFIKKHGFNVYKSRLPNAKMFVEDLLAVAPEKSILINELFNEIIVYENRVLYAKKIKKPDGKFDVEMKLSLKKIKTTPNGDEKNISFQEEVPIGVRNKEGQFIYYKRHLLKDGEDVVKIQLNEEPYRAGLDPLNTFINILPKDNEMRL